MPPAARARCQPVAGLRGATEPSQPIRTTTASTGSGATVATTPSSSTLDHAAHLQPGRTEPGATDVQAVGVGVVVGAHGEQPSVGRPPGGAVPGVDPGVVVDRVDESRGPGRRVEGEHLLVALVARHDDEQGVAVLGPGHVDEVGVRRGVPRDRRRRPVEADDGQ